MPRVTIRRQVVSRSGGDSANHGRRDARRFQASPLVGATLRLRRGNSAHLGSFHPFASARGHSPPDLRGGWARSRDAPPPNRIHRVILFINGNSED